MPSAIGGGSVIVTTEQTMNHADCQYSVAVKGPEGHIFYQVFRLPDEDSEMLRDESALFFAHRLLQGARGERIAHLEGGAK